MSAGCAVDDTAKFSNTDNEVSRSGPATGPMVDISTTGGGRKIPPAWRRAATSLLSSTTELLGHEPECYLLTLSGRSSAQGSRSMRCHGRFNARLALGLPDAPPFVEEASCRAHASWWLGPRPWWSINVIGARATSTFLETPERPQGIPGTGIRRQGGRCSLVAADLRG